MTGGDAIAVNLLAWAAVDVLRGLAKAAQKNTFLGVLEAGIRPEHVGKWRKLLKDHHNFLKHAAQDPGRVVEDFVPEAATWALFAAVEDYRSLFGMITFPMHLFWAWFTARNPNLLNEELFYEFTRVAPELSEIPNHRFDRSLESAADAFSIYLAEPNEIWKRFEAGNSTIEW
jgi:hypothetical protein